MQDNIVDFIILENPITSQNTYRQNVLAKPVIWAGINLKKKSEQSKNVLT